MRKHPSNSIPKTRPTYFKQSVNTSLNADNIAIEAIVEYVKEQCVKACEQEMDEWGGYSDGYIAAKYCKEAIMNIDFSDIEKHLESRN